MVSKFNPPRFDKYAVGCLTVRMHKLNHIALYKIDKTARLGLILDVVPGANHPYLICDRYSKIRFWASEEEVLDSIAPAQPSKSRATVPEL